MNKILSFLLLAGSCLAQDRPFMDCARESRVDVIMIGDSNQLFGGYGFDSGWSKYLYQKYGQFATGIHWFGENHGNGAGVGYGSSTYATAGSRVFTYSNGPGVLEYMNFAAFGCEPDSYLSYEGPGTNVGVGIRVDWTSHLNIHSNLTFEYCHALLPDGNIFRPCVRYEFPPYQIITQDNWIDSTYITETERINILSLPAAHRNGSIAFRMSCGAIYGHNIFYFGRVIDDDKNNGCSVSTLYGYGGQSSYDMANTFKNMSASAFSRWFARISTRNDGKIIFRINTGLNDLNETHPSINGYPGNTPAAYLDNLQTIYEKLFNFANEMHVIERTYFVFSISHPISVPNHPTLVKYGEITDVMNRQYHCQVIRIDKLITADQIEKIGGYNSSTDHYHLKTWAYDLISEKEINAINLK